MGAPDDGLEIVRTALGVASAWGAALGAYVGCS